MTIKINKHTFSGTSSVFDGKLAGILMSLAANQAIIAAATVADLTDNSGGTANGTISAIPVITNHQLVGTDSVQKAATETALGTVRDALSEIIAQLNDVKAVLPAFPTLADNTGGTAADGTVGAISVTLAGVSVSLASAVGVRAVAAALASRLAQATHFVNLAAATVGIVPVVDNSGGASSVATTFAAVSLDTGAAVDGADATDAKAGVAKTEADALLAALRDGVTELVVKLNAITSGSPTITVVAG